MTRVRPWRPLLLGCFGITWRDMKGDCSIHFEKRLAIWTLRVDEGGGIGTWLFLWNKGTCDLYAQVGRSTGLSENWAWWLGGLNPYNLDLEKSHVKPLLTCRREPQLGMLWDAFSSCGPPSSGYKVEYSSMTACSFVQTFFGGGLDSARKETAPVRFSAKGVATTAQDSQDSPNRGTFCMSIGIFPNCFCICPMLPATSNKGHRY